MFIGNRIGSILQNIWDVNICEVETLGTYVGWEHLETLGQTHERDTLEFLRTMETAFGKASSRINFQKTHGEQIVNVIGNIMGEQKSETQQISKFHLSLANKPIGDGF